MTAAAKRASAYVRVCAWKSRLLDRQSAAPLFLAADPAAMERAIDALEVHAPMERLLRVFRMALRAYPTAAPLLRAMLRLHEMENVKLLWRVILKRHDRRSARRLWTAFGNLATFGEDAFQATGPRDLAERLGATPYKMIASDVLRAYGEDLGAAEMAFDRWASLRLLETARKLPKKESLARRLVESVVRERDSEIVRRGQRWFGLSEPAVRAAAAFDTQGEEPSRLRRERLRLCRRAFVGDPFTLAPPVALILLAEEEVRGIRALIERRGDATLDDAAMRAAAGAQFGS